VFVLTDDLAWNLVRYMPRVRALQRAGTTFANYTVTDSLCCPSRSSIFSGKFPHNTGVFTNYAPDGGYHAFSARGMESSTFATDLRTAGYRTAMMGKYLNGYQPQHRVVPAGWTEWDVAGNAYAEYGYRLLENRRLRHYGNRPADYLTDVLSANAQRFITASAAARQPFLLEVATFAPHAPFTPAARDENKFLTVRAPRTGGYDRLPSAAPSWLGKRRPLTGASGPRSTSSSAYGLRPCRRSTACWARCGPRSAAPASRGTPSWCSARTTVSTWASTG
jgi:arylsulfatase A-like enzyme